MVLLFWIVMDSVGCIPIFVSLLRHFNPAKQKEIVIRELLIALFVMILFLFFGKWFFILLDINASSLSIAGGIILFIIAIRMIFGIRHKEHAGHIPKDPLVVPLAIPAIAGPAILATITLYGGSEGGRMVTLLAIVVAWLFSLPILFYALSLKKILGENGIIAVERLFGFILVLISTEMAKEGFITALHLRH